MLLLFRNRAGGGGLVLPPDYNPATDDLFIAQPGYLYSDAAGTTLLPGAGNALSWRSLRGTLAPFTDGLIPVAAAWNGADAIALTGTQYAAVTTGVRSQPETILTAAQVTTPGSNGYLYCADSATGFAQANSATSLRIFAGSVLSLSVADASILGVLTAVFNGASSVIRCNGSEATGSSGSTQGTNVQIGRRPTSSFLTGLYKGFWWAPGRAFDAAQRAANEASFAALTGVVLP